MKSFIFELRLLPFCKFAHFAILRYRQKHFKNIKFGKNLKIDIKVENGGSFMKEYELRHIFEPILVKIAFKVAVF